MSTDVEQRVVQMEFDNSTFERNARTTINTLDKLEQSLNFTDSSGTLDNIRSSIGRLNFSGITSGAEAVRQKFSALEVVAVGALMKIGAQAVTTGERLVKSLSIDQITAGWSKYEQKVTAVQTIMSATSSSWESDAKKMSLTAQIGESFDFATDKAEELYSAYAKVEDGTWSMDKAARTLGVTTSELKNQFEQIGNMAGYEGDQMEYVSSMLDKLNWFSDETSYSFTDMTSSIGKFTSNGIALSDAVTAMEGISTWAALSGQNTQSASRAMYNLAQAISVGSVKLMDWKSIENANMATSEFKQTAIETAVELGTLKKVSDGLYQTMKGNEVSVTNFNANLSDAWFSADVLMKSLDRYGNAAVRLSEISDDTGMTASQFLAGMEIYKEGVESGEVTTEQWAKIMRTTGQSVEVLTPLFEELSASEYDLGLRAFKAAQEAKTLSEAIDATKDAVSTGWMQTFELIFGNYEEAKELFTDLANALWEVFAASGEARNGILELWSQRGGRDDLIEAFWNLWDALSNISEIAHEAFKEMFPSTWLSSATKLLDFGDRLKNLTERFRDFFIAEGELTENGENLKKTFEGVFAIFDMAKTIISGVLDIFGSFTKYSGNIVSSFLKVTASISEWLIKADESLKTTVIFETISSKITVAIDYIIKSFNKFKETISSVANYVKNTATFENFINILESVKNRVESITESFKKMKEGIEKGFDGLSVNPKIAAFATFSEKIVSIFNTIWSVIGKVAELVGTTLASGFQHLSEAIAGAKFEDFIDLLNSLALFAMSGGLGGLIGKLNKDDIFTSIAGIAEDAGERFSDALKPIHNTLVSFQNSLDAKVIKQIAEAIAILTASLVVLSMIDSEKLAGAIGSITALFAELLGSMASFSKLNGAGALKGLSTGMGIMMIEMASSILILSFALKEISSIDSDALAKSLLGITGLMAEIFTIASAMSVADLNINRVGFVLIELSAAILILSKAVKELSSIDPDKLYNGVLAVSALITELSVFTYINRFGKSMVGLGLGMIAVAAAVTILADSVSKLGDIDQDKIFQGLMSVGMILVELSAFTYISKDASKMISIGIGMIALGAAVRILYESVKLFSELDTEQLTKGLIALGTIIAELSLFTAIAKNSKGVFSAALAMTILGGAIEIMADVVSKLGGMSVDSLVRSLSALGAGLLEMTLALKILKNDGIGGALALTVLSVALSVFTPQLIKMGDMQWDQIAKGLTALGVSLGLLVAAGLIANGAAVGLLSLSAALIAIGAASLAIGAGVALLGVGLNLIVISLHNLALVAVTASGSIVGALTVLATGFATIIPIIATGLANAVVAFAKAIARSASQLGEAVKEVILAICAVIKDCVPEIVDTVFVVLQEVLDSFNKYLPVIIDSFVTLIIAVLDGLTARMPELVNSVVKFIATFFASITQALKGLDTDFIKDAVEAMGLVAALMIAASQLSAIAAEAFAGIIEVGLVIVEIAAILAALGAIAQIPGLDWIIGEGGKLLQTIGTAIGKFIGGILGGIASGASAALPEIGNNLTEFMNNASGFITQASKIDSGSLDGVNALCGIIAALTAETLLNGIANFVSGSPTALVDFGKQLAEFGPYFAKFADSIFGIDATDVEASSNAALALANIIPILTADSIINGLINWVTKGNVNLSEFGKQLAEFGPYFASFMSSVFGVNTSNAESASNAALALSNIIPLITAESVINGLASWGSKGNINLSEFGKQLAEFGPYFANFIDSVLGIDTTNADSAIAAVDGLAKIIPILTAESVLNGLSSMYSSGQINLANFGKELAEFGPYFASFANSMTDIDSSGVSAASEAMSFLSDIILTLSAEGIVTGLANMYSAGKTSLVSFGQDLAEFGPYFASFANSVSDIDTEKANSAISSISALAEIIKTLTAESIITGLAQMYSGGQISLANFGKDLYMFGPLFSDFANSISDFDADKTNAAINSITALSEIIKILTVESVISGLVKLASFGQVNLVDFGKQLAEFGPYFAEFANSFSAIDSESIASAVESATSIAKLIPIFTADTVINGLSNIIGNSSNALVEFGKQLSEFGPYFAEFANSTAGIDVASVEASAHLVKSLALIAGLFAAESIVSGNISKYGEELVSFGNSFVEFYNTVVGVDSSKVDYAMSIVRSVSENGQLALDEIATTFTEGSQAAIEAVNTVFDNLATAASDGSYGISSIGPKIVDDLIAGIQEKTSEITSAMQNLANTIFNDMANELESFRSIGGRWMVAIRSAMEEQYDYIYNSFDSFKTSLLEKFAALANDIVGSLITGLDGNNTLYERSFEDFMYRGLYSITEGDFFDHLGSMAEDIVTTIVTTLDDGSYDVEDAFKSILIDPIKDLDILSQFTEIGEQMIDGLITGINNKESDLYSAVEDVAGSAAQSARTELGIHSPSKVFDQIGDYCVIALVNSFNRGRKKTSEAARTLASDTVAAVKSAIALIAEAIDEGLDTEPTIRPVLDLSDIESKTAALNGLFGNTSSLHVKGIDSSMAGNKTINTNQNEGKTSTGGASYVFNQYNSSPKALDPIEIYRQTRNQFTQLRGTI